MKNRVRAKACVQDSDVERSSNRSENIYFCAHLALQHRRFGGSRFRWRESPIPIEPRVLKQRFNWANPLSSPSRARLSHTTTRKFPSPPLRGRGQGEGAVPQTICLQKTQHRGTGYRPIALVEAPPHPNPLPHISGGEGGFETYAVALHKGVKNWAAELCPKYDSKTSIVCTEFL